MKTVKLLIVGLAVIAVLELVAAVQASQSTGSDKPPAFAYVALIVLAVATLIGAYGVSRGTRWARPVIYTASALRMVSAVLGIGNHTSAGRLVIGTAGVALSIAVVVVLIRTRRQSPASLTQPV